MSIRKIPSKTPTTALDPNALIDDDPVAVHQRATPTIENGEKKPSVAGVGISVEVASEDPVAIHQRDRFER